MHAYTQEKNKQLTEKNSHKKRNARHTLEPEPESYRKQGHLGWAKRALFRRRNCCRYQTHDKH